MSHSVLNMPQPALKSSRFQVFFKIGVLKNLENFTGKHLFYKQPVNKQLALGTEFVKQCNFGAESSYNNNIKLQIFQKFTCSTVFY